MDTQERPKQINNEEDLDHLIQQVNNGSHFALAFNFKEYQLFQQLLERLGIDYEVFRKTYFYFDNIRNLHISESEFKRFWISTIGLVAGGKTTTNNFVNSCITQYTVVSLLIDKSIEVCSEPRVFDIDSYNFGQLNQLTQGLFHNLLFYFELFGKAYLSLSAIKVPKTHNLSKIYKLVTKTMYEKGHNDSLFQVSMLDEILLTVEYVTAIPGNFKEEYIKYDDNPNDETAIVFNSSWFHILKNTTDLCNDFVYNYYYEKDNCYSLKIGLLERVLQKCKTEEEKTKLRKKYKHLNGPIKVNST